MRFSTTYGIAGPTTFRLSSSAILDIYGGNAQNWNKGVRKIFKPDKGKKFIQNDQSGAEALIVAYLCRHGLYRDLFLNNIKIHVFVALHIFAPIWQHHINKSTEWGLDTKPKIQDYVDCPIDRLTSLPFWKEIDELIKSSDDWPSEQRYYYIGKQIAHSSNYDVKAGMFCLNTLIKSKGRIALTHKQASEYLNMYFSFFPEIHEWHSEVQQQLALTGILYNLQGYPREFTGTNINYKEAYAFVPQSTVACITREAFCKLQEFIEQTGVDWDLMADGHDSYLVQCPIEEEHECAKTMQQFMNQELTSPRGEKFRMKSELQSGFNWGPYHEEKNPDGLKQLKLS